MGDRARRVAPSFLIFAVLSLAAGLPVKASPSRPGLGQTTAPGALSLQSQSPWHPGSQPITLGLAIRAPAPEGLEVAVSIYRRVQSRSEFAQTLQGRIPGRPVDEIPAAAVTDLAVNDQGATSFSFVPAVGRDGVFPMRVELRPRGGGKAVDSFLTYLVNVPEVPEGDPLDVAWIVPVHAAPAVQPDGHVNIDDGRAEQLSRLAAALGRHSDVAFTADVTPETAEALAGSARSEDRETLANLVTATRTGHQLLGGGFVPTNLSSFVDAGLEGEAATQLTRGAATLRALFGAEPTSSTRVADERLSDGALVFLQGQPQPVDHIVVPEASLEPVARNTTLTGTFVIESRRGRIPAAMADTALSSYFSGAGNPVLSAAQLVADLAIVYFDSPGTKRGLVVATPRSWVPSAPFVDAFLNALTANPVLRGVTMDQFFTNVPPEQGPPVRGRADRTLVRRMLPSAATTAATLPGATIRDARRRIDAFASAVDLTNPAGAAVVDRMDKTLLSSESSDLRTRDRSQYLQGAASQVDGEIRDITMPQNRSITLTARAGEIPVTVTRRLDYPVHAVLRLDSDTLEFPQPKAKALELNRLNTTEQFTVRAPSSGSFPLRVRLESPEGGLVLAQSRFTVRSTAISGVGTALSIGALAFLAVWWGNHLRGRRSRRLVPAG